MRKTSKPTPGVCTHMYTCTHMCILMYTQRSYGKTTSASTPSRSAYNPQGSLLGGPSLESPRAHTLNTRPQPAPEESSVWLTSCWPCGTSFASSASNQVGRLQRSGLAQHIQHISLQNETHLFLSHCPSCPKQRQSPFLLSPKTFLTAIEGISLLLSAFLSFLSSMTTIPGVCNIINDWSFGRKRWN